MKQETVSGSGISWAICKFAPRSRQITTPAPHHSVFLQAGCPSCCPTNSVKALKAKGTLTQNKSVFSYLCTVPIAARHCCSSQSMSPTRQTHSNNPPHAAAAGERDRQTDTTPFHRPCSAHHTVWAVPINYCSINIYISTACQLTSFCICGENEVPMVGIVFQSDNANSKVFFSRRTVSVTDSG